MNIVKAALQRLFGVEPTNTASAGVSALVPVAVARRPVIAGRRNQRRVTPDSRPLREVRGWRRVGNVLKGAYRTRYGSFAGEIDVSSARPSFWIINPPAAVLNGPHRPCFRPRGGGGRYWVHFGMSSFEIDAGIAAIERLIFQSLQPRRGEQR
jgi:hypothetical protein